MHGTRAICNLILEYDTIWAVNLYEPFQRTKSIFIIHNHFILNTFENYSLYQY
jgi:hypothetical protein